MPKSWSWRSGGAGESGMSMLRLLSQTLAVLVITAVTLASLPALHAQQSFAHGAVVALRGTPHLWIADAQGVLHWGGDTRALTGKHVNWGDRTEVTLGQLRGLAVGDPWLSAGLLKDGDPIYLVKWESNWERPRLLHIQSIADVELFGIDGSNYGRFVLDKATWEAQYGMSAASLQRSVLPAAVPTAQPQQVDPRLQPVLDFIATTAGGELVVASFEETGASLTYGNLQTAAHYDLNSNAIVLDEGMSSQPLAVLAFILVHEIQHAQFPWTEYGQDCFRGELMADLNAVLWWWGKYGYEGHPDTGNEFVRNFNYELSLWAQDVRDGTKLWNARMREKHADLCRLSAAVPTPTPLPTPAPTSRPTPVLSAEPGVYDPVEVERFFSIYQGYASAALAEIYDVNPRGAQTSMLLDLFAERIEALPMMYMMHVWATGGPESGHPLLNIKLFTLAYFKDYRHYARLTTQWLDDLAANPCAALLEEREWVIWIETYWPGALKATIEMSYQPDWLVQHAVKAALQEAARELAENPNAVTERYGCKGG